MPDVKITKGYVPGSIGRVVELYGEYYNSRWGFGADFEAWVAADLAEFLGRYDEKRDGFWIASLKGRIEGSITNDGVDAAGEGAQLRWLIVSDALRGKGLGNRLIDRAVEFCRDKGYRRVYLWTLAGLDAAIHLYEKNGFKLVKQHKGAQFGVEVNIQRFELRLE
jgi:GNAT superfamily N-acetyltransferase